MKKTVITRTIWLLSIVSLFTDMASEMLYPVMPVFLRSIGFSFLLIGVLEGFAEAIAGLSKTWFGKMSDASGKRLPFVRWGYLLSALSKPMMAAFIFPLWIFLARTVDRLGKGVRTAARDALLSDESTAENKGRVFGFHRSMDTFGAVLGPALALAFLYFYPGRYRLLFLIAFLPGLAAVISTFLIKEKKLVIENSHQQWPDFASIFNYLKLANKEYKILVTGLLVFALVNSSDVFLLLKMKEAGMSDVEVIGLYIFYNMVFAIFAYPLGILSDKLGMKKVLLAGLLVFVIVYAGFAFSSSSYLFLLFFFLYGVYASATEGISIAWISRIVDKKETGTAFGTFTGIRSICALIASSLTGFLWVALGSAITLCITAAVTLLVAVYLYLKATDKIPLMQNDVINTH